MQYNKVPTTVPEMLKITLIIWIALLLGQIFFLIVCLFLTYLSKMEVHSSLQNIFLTVGIFIPMILIFISLKIFDQRMINIDKSKSLFEKLIEYRTTSIIRWALIESCVFLNLVFFLAAGNQYNLLIGILILGYFAFNAPTKNKISSALQLEQKETDTLYSK